MNNEISKHGNNLSQSTILTEEISALRKNNDNNQKKISELQNENKQLKNRMAEIKTSYVSHDEDFNNIKKALIELNKKTEINLKKIQENEKKFDICKGGSSQNIINQNKENKNENFNNEKCEDIKNEAFNSCIKEIENNIGEYKTLIDGIKNNTNNFGTINNELI